MEPYLIPLLSLAVGVIGGLIGAHVGVKVALGKLETRVEHVESEIKLLREAKHDHAQFLTKHEADLEVIKRKVL